MRTLCLFVVLYLVVFVSISNATIFGSVRGVVHDSEHLPIPDVQITLKAKDSVFTLTAQTDVNGDFHFDAVPVAEYVISASKADFASSEQAMVVLSGTAPVLHFELQLASQTQSVTVSAEAAPGQTESITPTTLVDREQIQQTPGASRTNSLALITNYVPGSYLTHDQLHIRGGHQVSWLIDGEPIPNKNIAETRGPQIDHKQIIC